MSITRTIYGSLAAGALAITVGIGAYAVGDYEGSQDSLTARAAFDACSPSNVTCELQAVGIHAGPLCHYTDAQHAACSMVVGRQTIRVTGPTDCTATFALIYSPLTQATQCDYSIQRTALAAAI